MKIYFILTTAPRYKEAALNNNPFRYYEPQTLNILAYSVKKHFPNCHICIIDQGITPVNESIDIDIAVISSNTSGINEAYRLCTKFRNRGIKTIIGGSHVTALPDEAAKYADIVVVGPGEIILPEIIEDIQKKQERKFYNGFNKKCIIGKRYTFKRNKKYFPVDTIELTRGCKNNCLYCVIGKTNQNKQYVMPIKDAISEIEKMGKNILFLDSNPFQNKEYFKEFLTALIKMKKTWAAAATINIVNDDNMLKLLKKSGCIGLLIGFESIDEKSINSVNKHFNNPQKYKEAIKKLHSYDIGVLATFTLGLDNDDKNIFDNTLEFVINSKIDLVKYGILVPLPGSEIFEIFKNQNRILTYDWSLYDTEHVVYQPKNMSAEELLNGYKKLNKKTYSFKSIIKRSLRKRLPLLYYYSANLAFKHYARNI